MNKKEVEDMTIEELRKIYKLHANETQGRAAYLEIQKRLHQPEHIFGYSVAKVALAIAVFALAVAVWAAFKTHQ